MIIITLARFLTDSCKLAIPLCAQFSNHISVLPPLCCGKAGLLVGRPSPPQPCTWKRPLSLKFLSKPPSPWSSPDLWSELFSLLTHIPITILECTNPLHILFTYCCPWSRFSVLLHRELSLPHIRAPYTCVLMPLHSFPLQHWPQLSLVSFCPSLPLE